MATRPGAVPTEIPDWALSAINDPVTGQPNKAEPLASKKVTGFDFNEKPKRGHLNWLFNALGKWRTSLEAWRDYMDQETTKSQAGVHATSFRRCFPLKSNAIVNNASLDLLHDMGSVGTGSFVEVRATLKLSGTTDQFICFGRILVDGTNLDTLSFERVAYNAEPNANAGNDVTASNMFIIIPDGTHIGLFNNTGGNITVDFGHIEVLVIKA